MVVETYSEKLRLRYDLGTSRFPEVTGQVSKRRARLRLQLKGGCTQCRLFVSLVRKKKQRNGRVNQQSTVWAIVLLIVGVDGKRGRREERGWTGCPTSLRMRETDVRGVNPLLFNHKGGFNVSLHFWHHLIAHVLPFFLSLSLSLLLIFNLIAR